MCEYSGISHQQAEKIKNGNINQNLNAYPRWLNAYNFFEKEF